MNRSRVVINQANVAPPASLSNRSTTRHGRFGPFYTTLFYLRFLFRGFSAALVREGSCQTSEKEVRRRLISLWRGGAVGARCGGKQTGSREIGFHKQKQGRWGGLRAPSRASRVAVALSSRPPGFVPSRAPPFCRSTAVYATRALVALCFLFTAFVVVVVVAEFDFSSLQLSLRQKSARCLFSAAACLFFLILSTT